MQRNTDEDALSNVLQKWNEQRTDADDPAESSLELAKQLLPLLEECLQELAERENANAHAKKHKAQVKPEKRADESDEGKSKKHHSSLGNPFNYFKRKWQKTNNVPDSEQVLFSPKSGLLKNSQ